MQVECTCQQCGAVFLRKPSKIRSPLTFCSRTCKGLRMRFRTERPCQQCGAPVPVDAIRTTSRQRGKYCSFACSNAGRTQPIVERFWAKVEKTETCWLWTGQFDSDGYGRIKTSNRPRRRIRAHALSWAIHFGPIPAGLVVCHRCDNPPCVRPDHLFLGTTADNQHDKVAKGRQARGEAVGAAKLTAEQVLEIRSRYANGGVSQAALAVDYDIGSGAIWAVVTRRTWKHL